MTYTVDEVYIPEGAYLGDCGCGWIGTEDQVAPIGFCSLTAGDPSPAGRCPECDCLVYVLDPQPDPTEVPIGSSP